MIHGTMEIRSLERGTSGPMIYDGRRPDRGRGIVQIYQTLAVNLLLQLRKLLSQLNNIHINIIPIQKNTKLRRKWEYNHFIVYFCTNRLSTYMIDYISGTIKTLNPTFVIIENSGIGHIMEISLQTYDKLNGKKEAVIYIQSQVNQREGTQTDYGFASQDERNLFRKITSVSGMGAASARMLLSSLSPAELKEAIVCEDVNRLKSVKGIGLKSAQRLVLELKDKLGKEEDINPEIFAKSDSNNNAEEAMGALINLGFSKPNISKAIQAILKKNPGASVEDLIKGALRML